MVRSYQSMKYILLLIKQIFPKDPSVVKTFGIVCTYKSKFGYHTMYKEIRATTENEAINNLCIFKDFLF